MKHELKTSAKFSKMNLNGNISYCLKRKMLTSRIDTLTCVMFNFGRLSYDMFVISYVSGITKVVIRFTSYLDNYLLAKPLISCLILTSSMTRATFDCPPSVEALP